MILKIITKIKKDKKKPSSDLQIFVKLNLVQTLCKKAKPNLIKKSQKLGSDIQPATSIKLKMLPQKENENENEEHN